MSGFATIESGSRADYRRLLDSMRDAFAMADMDGRFKVINAAFEALVGYTAEELGGMTYQDITPEKWHEPEARILEEQVLPRGYSEVFEKEYRHKDGSIVPVELRISSTRDAKGNLVEVSAVVRDISERKRMEQELLQSNELLELRVAERTAELHESEARFRQLSEVSLEGIVVSENGIIIDANDQFAAMLGYGLSELIGRPALETVAPQSLDLVSRRREEGYEGAYECDALRKDGSTFTCEVRGRTTAWQGRAVRVTVVRDLTESKRAEAELSAHRDVLAHARRMALRSEISAGVVHQIGQPLTAVGNNLVALRSMVSSAELGDREVEGLLAETEAELKRIRTTMAHLHALAHPDQQRRAPADLNALLKESRALVGARIGGEGVEITLDLDPDLPELSVDAVQMIQVFCNIIQNACDAVATCPSGQRSITIASRACYRNAVEVSVSDSGPGITPVDEARLFEPFFTTKEKGVGIGLTLARRIVEAHGGCIDGVNNGGRPGAVFRVVLSSGGNDS